MTASFKNCILQSSAALRRVYTPTICSPFMCMFSMRGGQIPAIITKSPPKIVRKTKRTAIIMHKIKIAQNVSFKNSFISYHQNSEDFQLRHSLLNVYKKYFHRWLLAQNRFVQNPAIP